MFSSLVRNVIISAVAFFAVSVVGLLLVPVLIGSYGLAGFGQIALARLFLPLAALAILDIGFGEIATHSVASARGDGDWARCSRVLTLDLLVALAIGLTSAILLWLASSYIPSWASVPAGDHAALARVFRVTALLLPLLFMGIVFEGVLKGYENFAMQRLIEVVSALSYAAMVMLAVYLELSLDWVCFALLASLVMRTSLAAWAALRTLARDESHLTHWTENDRVRFLGRARVMSHNKIQGAVQANAPSLLVGVLIGPAGLGVYDALSRMPRFVKAVLGLLNSTVQPVTVRLEASLDVNSMARLGRLGLLLVAAVTAPVLGAAMALSEPVLRLWLGQSISPLWPWQAVYFVVPALGALVGFGGAALMVRTHVVKTMNRIGLLQISVTLLVGWACSDFLQERAFVAGQVLATLVTFPIYMTLIRREMGIGSATYAALARIFALALVMALPTLLVAERIASISVLIFCLVAWVAICWGVSVALALEVRHRKRLLQEFRQRWQAWRAS